MDDAGLVTAAYGSYYRLGGSDESEFSAVIEAANVLGAPGIRVWAGNRGTADSNDTYFQSVVVEALRLADLAQKANVVLSLEFHGGTLNDTYESSRRLLSACAHPAIATYWQRPLGLPEHESLDGLLSILPRVRDVHVFHWTAGSSGLIRHPLSEGSDFWNLTFNILRSSGRNHSVMLEFVCDDSPEVFREDAKTLVSLLDDSESLPA